MVKLSIVNMYGLVEIHDRNTGIKHNAYNNENLLLSGKFKIAIQAHPGSGATLIIKAGNETVKKPLKANSVFRISDEKPKRPSKVQTTIGKIWYSINDLLGHNKDFDDDSGNAVIGVRG